jgi:hypothetical protein
MNCSPSRRAAASKRPSWASSPHQAPSRRPTAVRPSASSTWSSCTAASRRCASQRAGRRLQAFASAPLEDRLDWTGALLAALADPDVASKEELVRQYDHEVKGMSIEKPFTGVKRDAPSDGGVLKPLYDSWRGLTVIPRHLSPALLARCARHGPRGGRRGVSRAHRARAAIPERAVALDNFCWPDPCRVPANPDGAYKLAQLVRACEALREACLAYRPASRLGQGLDEERRFRRRPAHLGRADPPRHGGRHHRRCPQGSLHRSPGGRRPSLHRRRHGQASSAPPYSSARSRRRAAFRGALPCGTASSGPAPSPIPAEHLPHLQGDRQGRERPRPALLPRPLRRRPRGRRRRVLPGRPARRRAAPRRDPAPRRPRECRCRSIPAAASLLFAEDTGRFLVSIRSEDRERFERSMAGLPLALVGEATAEPRLSASLGGKAVLDAGWRNRARLQDAHSLKGEAVEPKAIVLSAATASTPTPSSRRR